MKKKNNEIEEKNEKSLTIENPDKKGDYCICAGEYGACAKRSHCDFANGFLGIEKGPFYISD